MVLLGQLAQWSRSDLRALTPTEFVAYLDAALEVERARGPHA